MNKTVIAAALTLSSSLALAAGTTTTDNPPTPNITPVPGAESPARTPEPVERDAVPGKERAVRAEPFATFDDNKDGLISGDEIKDIKNLDLAKVDRNHDGRISPADCMVHDFPSEHCTRSSRLCGSARHETMASASLGAGLSAGLAASTGGSGATGGVAGSGSGGAGSAGRSSSGRSRGGRLTLRVRAARRCECSTAVAATTSSTSSADTPSTRASPRHFCTTKS